MRAALLMCLCLAVSCKAPPADDTRLPTVPVTLPNGKKVSFPIDGFAKTCLLEGVDELGYLLKFEKQVAAYEAARL